MTHDLTVILTFTGGLAGALVLGYVAHRLGVSAIVGYLLAGILVGPFTPGFVANRAIADQFAEIGVILLLFGIGLRFHLNEMIAMWRIVVPGALIQSAISTAALAAILHLMGWPWTAGIILGMAISVASTVVMALVLGERHDLHSQIGYIAIGWTVVEDLLTIVMLLLLPVIFADGGAGAGIAAALGTAALQVVALLVTVFVLARWVIPGALERIERTRSRELFTLAVLVLALGVAVGSAEIFGVSMALGAFLAGLAVGRSEFAARAALDAVPMRDAFAVLFFVSVGMLFNPGSLVEAPLAILAVLFVVVVVKPLAALLTVRMLGVPLSTAAPVGAAFAQVGEFSFILGSVARSLGLIDDVGWNAVVAASILSIVLNPFIYRWVRAGSASTLRNAPSPEDSPREIDPARCILVGYGPVGKVVRGLLEQDGAAITLVDLNLETIRMARAAGLRAVYGDVLRPGTLEEAGVRTAGSLVLSADVDEAAEVVRRAVSLNPDLRVLVRCAHLRDAPALRSAGAHVVAAGEAEVGVALAEAVAAGSRANTPEYAPQRDAIRRRLYDVPPVESHR